MDGAPWVVVPTYNEADCVVPIVDAILAADPRVRVLIVDDQSPDGTGEIADGLAAAHPGTVDVLHRTQKLGLGPAYVAGFAHALAAGATHVVQMDADFSHDPADVPMLIDTGADLAIGSRYVAGGAIENWNRVRRLVSWGGNVYARAVLRVPVRDVTSGFKCFTAEALAAIEFETIRSHGYSFQVELIYRSLRRGLHVRELPIVFHERREGQSKMSGAIALEAMLVVPRIKRLR